MIDGTACVGGNTIVFSNVFEHVFAVEIDETRCAMLRNNLSVLGCKNVTCMCADFVRALPDLPDCELLFLGPEWGRPEYVNLDKVSLQVGDPPLASLWELADDRVEIVGELRPGGVHSGPEAGGEADREGVPKDADGCAPEDICDRSFSNCLTNLLLTAWVFLHRSLP